VIERIKNIALFLLIGLSVFLSWNILADLPDPGPTEEAPNELPLFLSRAFSAKELIGAETIRVHYGNDLIAAVAYDAQEQGNSHAALTEAVFFVADGTSFVSCEADAFETARRERLGLEFRFAGNLPEELVDSVFGTHDVFGPVDAVAGMYLTLSDGVELFILDSSGERCARGPANLTPEASERFGKLLSGEGLQENWAMAKESELPYGTRELAIPLSAQVVTRGSLSARDVDHSRLTAMLFPNFGLVRRVEESRSAYYMDSRRAVRVFDNGLLEYHDSGVNRGDGDVAAAYGAAVEFVNHYGGFDSNMYLTGISADAASGAVTVSFGLRLAGTPVVDLSAVEVTLCGTTVTEYSRSIFELTSYSSGQVQSHDALAALEVIGENYRGDGLSVVDLNLLVHAETGTGGSTLMSVWQATLSDGSTICLTTDGLQPLR